MDGVTVFHAGTAHNADGELVTAGGHCAERGCAGQDVRRSPREGLRGLRRHQLRGANSCAPTSAKAAAGLGPGSKASPFVHEAKLSSRLYETETVGLIPTVFTRTKKERATCCQSACLRAWFVNAQPVPEAQTHR